MAELIDKNEVIETLEEAYEAGCVDQYTNKVRRAIFDEVIECIRDIDAQSYESVPVDFMREYIQRDGMSIHDISVISQMYEAYKETKNHE